MLLMLSVQREKNVEQEVINALRMLKNDTSAGVECIMGNVKIWTWLAYEVAV